MALDPVCKMEVDERQSKFVSSHGGKDYYFCSAGCKSAFEKEPSKYTK